MKKKVFISGPIIGREKQQDYRRIITDIAAKMDLEVIDPWKEKEYSSMEQRNAGGIRCQRLILYKETLTTLTDAT